MKIVFSEEADSDLLHIVAYLAVRNRTAALNLANSIDLKIGNLAHFPFMGRERDALSPGLRSIVVENYVVFYRFADDELFVVRVLDGRRDIDAEFQE